MLRPDGDFRFSALPTAGPNFVYHYPCQSNPPGCPSTYASAMSQEAPGQSPSCSGSYPSLVCDYPEAVCGCGDGSSRSAWTCQVRPPAGGPCPTQRPLAGDACPKEGQQCDYSEPCADGTRAGWPMICRDGYWELFTASSTCSLTPP